MENNFKPAGFWIRTLAVFNDNVLIFFLLLLSLSQIIKSSSNLSELLNKILELSAFIIIPVLWCAFPVLNGPYLTSKFGGSLGKLITGLKVVNDEGKLLSFKLSLFRTFVGYNFSGILLGLGFLAISRDPEKKGWHDHATGSRVVIRRTLWPLSFFILTLLCLGNYLLINNMLNQYNLSPLKSEVSSLLTALYKDAGITSQKSP